MKKNICCLFVLLLAVSFGFTGGKVLAFESRNAPWNRIVHAEHIDVQQLQDEEKKVCDEEEEISAESVFEEKFRTALEEGKFFIAGIDSADGALQRLIDVCQPLRKFLEENDCMVVSSEEYGSEHYLYKCLQKDFGGEYELPLILIIPFGPPGFILELGNIRGMSSEELICLGEALATGEYFQHVEHHAEQFVEQNL
ncbi:MAG: hypothetical protein RSB82_03875 [Victivallaceae bacterium]